MVTYPSTHGVFEDHIARALRAGARRRRPGLRRRREPQRAGRAGPAGQVRRRRLAPEPAQDLLHPARRRRPRRRPGRGPRAPGAVPAEPPAAAAGRARRPGRVRSRRAPWGSASILPITWAYLRLMGAGRPGRGHRAPRSCPPTTSRRRLDEHYPVLYTGARRAWSRTSASSTCAPITKETGVTRRRRRQAADRLRLPRADDVVPGGRHADGRADRERGPAPRSTGSSRR